MQTADFDYELPPELIAQAPTAERDGSRLLVVHRRTGVIEHRECFRDVLQYLHPGDLLILNDSRVIRARLRAIKDAPRDHVASGEQGRARFELVLLEEAARNKWWAMVKPGKRAQVGTALRLLDCAGKHVSATAQVEAISPEGHRLLRFCGVQDLSALLEQIGEVPLPPYIARGAGASANADVERYQTVFARRNGSVAAPTAGLHFTQELIARATARGCRVGFVTLHVGYGTFAPVKCEELTEHRMHEELFEVSQETADAWALARQQGRRVVAVGTTTVRALETAAAKDGRIRPFKGRTNLFAFPPWQFKAVDAMITNFHLPRSTLLMLVSAFAAPGSSEGITLIKRAYAEAVRLRYRFFSYGDAMLLL